MDQGQCRDIDPVYLNRPILGVTWENDWKNGGVGLDELPASQIRKLKSESPFNLVSSYELDSHIPILYPDLVDFVDGLETRTLGELIHDVNEKQASIMFSISNCDAPLRPDRLQIMALLSKYITTSSYGKCLGEEANYAQSWNSRNKYGSTRHKEEMSKYLFVYAAENSYGMDYVTEVNGGLCWTYFSTFDKASTHSHHSYLPCCRKYTIH